MHYPLGKQWLPPLILLSLEAGSHVERLSLDLMWTKAGAVNGGARTSTVAWHPRQALLERSQDTSGANDMKKEIWVD